MRLKTLLTFLCITATSLWINASEHNTPLRDISKTHRAFEENKGQIQGADAHQVTYVYQTPNISVFLRREGLSYQFSNRKMTDSKTPKNSQYQIETHRIDIDLVGINPNAQISHEGGSSSYKNYYTTQSMNVHEYSKVIYHDIYPHIDWVITCHTLDNENSSPIKYDFVVRPGGNPKDIRMKVKWAENLGTDKFGRMILQSKLGTIVENAPESYQGERPVITNFHIANDLATFDLGKYDHNQTLIIDPAIQWSSYYGDVNLDNITDIAQDKNGNIIVSGYTESTMSIASGGFQTTYAGNTDAFVLKMNAAGARLWSSYYGGSGTDMGYSCATDASNNIFLVGSTTSPNQIATVGSYQSTINISDDGFIVKFNENGTQLWGTYLGGDDFDRILGCAVDGSNNIIVTGNTLSNNQLATMGAYSTTNSGGFGDVFLAKFDNNGANSFVTYYGDASIDEAYSCATDASGNIYFTGNTYSTANIASGGHQNTFGGSSDAFLVKFSGAGARIWATYYGGTADDIGKTCTVDQSDNIYMGGHTLSTSDIFSSGYQSQLTGSDDGFVVKFDRNGNRLWGTYIGGSNTDDVNGLYADTRGNLWITGYTNSTDTIARKAMQPSLAGANDAFLCKFRQDGTKVWGTYFGGTQNDFGQATVANAQGLVYLTGNTQSSANIATTGAYQTSYQGSTDGYVTQIHDSIVPVIYISNNPSSKFCEGTVVEFTRIDTHAGTSPMYYWYKNGSLVGTDSTYKDSTLQNGDIIICKLKSNDTTVSVDTAWSNSLVMDVVLKSYGTDAKTICSGSFYLWNGDTLRTAGAHKDTLVNPNTGCDSIVTLTLTLLPKDTTRLVDSFCKGGFYTIDWMEFYTLPGVYVDTLQNVAGCDSIVILTLTEVQPDSGATRYASTCANVPYTLHGNTFTTAGKHLITIPRTRGLLPCDSIVTLFLTIIPTTSSLIDTQLCPGMTYTFNGIVQSSPGIYFDTFMGSNGCDSIVTLDLKYKQNFSTTIRDTFCQGDSVFFNTGYKKTQGLYYDTFVGSNGCDSFVILNLVVNQPKKKIYTWLMCQRSVPYKFNNKLYDSTGIYRDTFKASNGCDSIEELRLTVYKTVYDTIKDTICEGDLTYIFDNKRIDSSGIYTDSLLHPVTLCDSIVILKMYVRPKIRDTFHVYQCSGTYYTFRSLTDTIRKTGYYSDTFTSKRFGCDSIRILDLKIGLTKKLLLVDGINYSAQESPNISYQWYSCDPWRRIANQNQKTFTTKTFGRYAVVMSDGKCTDTSECLQLYTVGVSTIKTHDLIYYPNPTKDRLYVETTTRDKNASISVYDIQGKLIMSESHRNTNRYELDMKNIASGTYVIYFQTETKSEILKIEKE